MSHDPGLRRPEERPVRRGDGSGAGAGAAVTCANPRPPDPCRRQRTRTQARRCLGQPRQQYRGPARSRGPGLGRPLPVPGAGHHRCAGVPLGLQGTLAGVGVIIEGLKESFTEVRAKITVNAIVPVAATSMTETIPFLKPYVDALQAGEPLPPFARRELGFGSAEDAAGLVAFLASDAAAGISGQAMASAVTDSAVVTPERGRRRVRRGHRWSPNAIAEVWPSGSLPPNRASGSSSRSRRNERAHRHGPRRARRHRRARARAGRPARSPVARRRAAQRRRRSTSRATPTTRRCPRSPRTTAGGTWPR